MDINRRALEQVKAALQSAPRGMTITDVAARLGASRNSVAKYLDMLLIAGEVEMRTFGRSKIFRISGKVPLKTALSLSSDLIVFVDGDLMVIDANEQFLRFAGMRRDRVVGCPLDKISISLLNHRDVLLNLKDALRGTEYAREINVSRDGEEYHFKLKLIPVTSGDALGRIAITYENITARKRAEIALKASEARYRAVVEDQADLICRILPDTTITFANEAWCRNFHCRHEDIMGRRLFEIVPEQYRGFLRRDLDGITAMKPSIVVEAAILMPDGQEIWMQFNYRGIYVDKGRLAEVQIVARDITERKQAETLLKASEARYRAVVENQSDLIIRTLPDSTITFVNEACSRYCGMGFDRLVGRKFVDFMPQERRASILAQLERARAGGEPESGEELVRLPNGSTRWLHWAYRGILDESGRASEFQIVARDITDRKEAEIALAKSEANLRMICDRSPIGIGRISPDLLFVDVNPELCRITGYCEGELLRMSLPDLTHLDDRTRDREAIDSMISSLADHQRMEKRYVRKDGRTIWVRVFRRLIKDAEGKLQFIIDMAEDITELKQAEESLRLTQISVDRAADEINWVRQDGRLVYVNEACSRKLGYSREELLKMHVWEFDPLFTTETCQGLMDEARKHGHAEFMSVRRARDGHEYPVDITAICLVVGDEECLCACVRDISDIVKSKG